MPMLTPFTTLQDAFRLQNNLERRLMQRPTDAQGFTFWSPPVDVFESDEGITLTAELPGLSAKDIEVRVENDTLYLKGERKSETEENTGTWRRRERTWGSFSRSFALPPTLDTERIQATSKNGLLTIVLPRREETKPRQIEVKITE